MYDRIAGIVSNIDVERLRTYVRNLEGLRHGWHNYRALEEKAKFIEEAFQSFQLPVENQEFAFHGRKYRNIVATLKRGSAEDDCILLGAHYDAAWGSPGADDNASGMAVLLEAADLMRMEKLGKTVQFAAFTLEEPQPQTVHFLIGSDYFAREAKRLKRRYEGVFILESVGYTDNTEGSQVAPLFVRTPVPRKGEFLGVIANRRSKNIMDVFHSAAKEYVPELPIVTYKVPLSGRFIPETRFSDHASFWNYGYPALMLTDTAMFRNPHYHTHHDKFETLDFSFMSSVTKASLAAVLKLGGHCLTK